MPLPSQPFSLVDNPLIYSPFVIDFRIGAPVPPPPGGAFIISEVAESYLITEDNIRMVTE